MKALSTKQVLEICEATEAQCQQAALLMGRTFGQDHRWIPEGVKAGHYAASVVKVDGVDSFFVAHHVTLQNSLNVNAVVQLRESGTPEAFVPALIDLAKKLGCRGVEGITVRAGMVKRLIESGFKTAGVCMVLEFA